MVKNLACICFFSITLLACQTEEQGIWSEIIREPSDNFSKVFNNPDAYELQILYTQVERGADGEITLTRTDYNLDTTHYFYPASMVKMPVAFIALQRINDLNKYNIPISKSSSIKIYKNREPQTHALEDDSSESGLITIEHLIKKVFAVSDNDAYNRLFEFLGRDYINEQLRQKGAFSNSRILTRLGVDGFDYESNAYGNPMVFYDGAEVVYRKAEHQSTGNYLVPLQHTIKGSAYLDKRNEVVNEPFDMANKNFMNLVDAEGLLRRIIMPDRFAKNQQFDLTEEDLGFLKDCMSTPPSQFGSPVYSAKEFPDGFAKFFMYGDGKEQIPNHLKIYNKAGIAYGTVSDCAYIRDDKNNIEFFLSATLLVNENQVFNDGQYEYDEVGIPFLAELGRQIYDYELRKKI